MKSLSKLFLMITIVLSLTSYSYGAELFSPVFPATDKDTLACSVLNVGAKELTGLIEICGIKGCIETCKLADGLLNPNGLQTGRWANCSSTFDMSGAAFCKFTISGNSRDARALSCVVDSITGDVTACITAE